MYVVPRTHNYGALEFFSPSDAHIEMVFRFSLPYSIDDFLMKMNIPKLFSGIQNWEKAKIKFRHHKMSYFHDVSKTAKFAIEDRVIELFISFENCSVHSAADLMRSRYEMICMWCYDHVPLVDEMIISV